jgi:phage portal protein BeeE
MRFLDALLPTRAASMSSWVPPEDWIPRPGYGSALAQGVTTLYGKNPVEAIADNFTGYAWGCLQGNPIVSAVEAKRVEVFSEARFQFQELRAGRPGNLFGSPALSVLETPWPGGTTGDLLAKMLLHADFGGNAYVAYLADELVLLRPDWVEILMEAREADIGSGGTSAQVGWRKVGYLYYEGGKGQTRDPAVFLADEVAHFAPRPDPSANYRGLSWLTPVIREIQADGQMTVHKQKYLENAATSNLAVSLPKEITPDQFKVFVDEMDRSHAGAANAGKTLYTAGGADVTVIGADLKGLDFSAVSGKGETRIANAAGVPAVIAGLSEGMQGSSLNAGNYQSAKRSFADSTIRSLWRNVCGSLQVVVPAPNATRLWVDTRDVAFLRDDEKDLAEIQAKRAQTIRHLVDAGFDPASVVDAIETEDMSRLRHSGLYSVQLQLPGSAGKTEPASAA